MSKVMVVNGTTKEGKVFDLDNEAIEFNNFCRKAVLDFMYNDERDCVVTIGENKYLTITDESPEPIRWIGACVLFMDCVENGNWGDILDFYPIEED